MIDPNPSVADLDELIAKHSDDDAAMEEIVRGYLRCAIYVYQRHSVTRVLRTLQIDPSELTEELVSDLRAEGAKHVAEFRDWLIEELAGFGISAPASPLH